MAKKVLVAAAWPYVNGSLHLGHLAGLLGADVLARFHRARGDDVLFVSGSDCHGTPILVTAEREGRSAEEVAQQYHEEAIRMLIEAFGFSYSLYTKTMGAFHHQVARSLFAQIHEQGYLIEREENQLYCDQCQRFLPDRYVLGTCPFCNAERARGDQCDSCGKLLTPEELKNPFCRVHGVVPVWKTSRHLYFDLPQFEERLRHWVKKGPKQWRLNAIAQTNGQLAQGLHPRAVTRDLSWGVPVPTPGFEKKRMYVWFEAVMGYLSCSMEWADQQKTPDLWQDWWCNPDAIHYYVHGKDNIPFHTIIWPAMLMALGLHLPDRIVSSEYLTLGAKKFSKGEGVGVLLPDMAKNFDPDAVRFFLVLQGPETSDAPFEWQDFQNRVNGDLIGNLGNLWNRVYSMAHRYFDGVPIYMVQDSESRDLRAKGQKAFDDVAAAIEGLQLRAALQQILELSSLANQYLEQRAPWKQVRKDRAHAAETIGVALEIAETLRRLSTPIIPKAAARLGEYLGVAGIEWKYIPLPAGLHLEGPTPLFVKIQEEG